MEKFLRVTGPAAPLPTANIDTDVIMPKIFLKGIDRAGLSQGVFHDLRFDGDGVARPGFILNQPAMQGCRFLITGPNFGCGSSREHAVWGLLQYGIRAVIGTSFAGIFADNAANNGLLLVSLDDADLARLMAEVGPEGGVIEVDLEDCVIRAGRQQVAFQIAPHRRHALMDGLDRIGETLKHAAAIRSFEAEYLTENPWLTQGATQ